MLLESCLDIKGALIVSALAEKSKLEDHEKMVIKYGISSVVVDFNFRNLALLSSLLVPLADRLCLTLSLWSELKYAAAEIQRLHIGLGNYIVSGNCLTLGVLSLLSRCCLRKLLGRFITRMLSLS